MLKDLESSPSPENPVHARFEKFLKAYARYVLQDGGTDDQSRHLEAEIDWARANAEILPLPPALLQKLLVLLRTETPRYKQMMSEFMNDHMNFTTTGQGNIRKIVQQIENLKNADLLSEDEAGFFLDALKPSQTELELVSFMKHPWWKRIFS